MQPHDRAADREPQAEAGAGAFDRAAMELGEHALDVALGKAAAVVLDGNDDLLAAPLRAHPDYRSRRRVLGAVLEQVAERLLDQRRVDAHQRQVVGQLDDHAVRRQALGQARQHRAGDLAQRGPVAVRLDRARFQPRHLQDLGDVLGHLARLVEDAFRQRRRAPARQALAALARGSTTRRP